MIRWNRLPVPVEEGLRHGDDVGNADGIGARYPFPLVPLAHEPRYHAMRAPAATAAAAAAATAAAVAADIAAFRYANRATDYD